MKTVSIKRRNIYSATV